MGEEDLKRQEGPVPEISDQDSVDKATDSRRAVTPTEDMTAADAAPDIQQDELLDDKKDGEPDADPLDVKTRHLLRRDITYAEAKEDQENILHRLGYFKRRAMFYSHLYRSQDIIRETVALHLGLPSSDLCHIAEPEEWLAGSFNVCLRVDIDAMQGEPARQVMIRFPLPYRIGHSFRRGNASEKVRTEAGTYTWLNENCPSIRIPKLYGFGLDTGSQTFTLADNLSFVRRHIHHLRRWFCRRFGYQVPTLYLTNYNKHQETLISPYMLIEFIPPSEGEALWNTWNEKHKDPKLRKNLFHGIARIMLTMARVPVPKIGSFVIDENGYLVLRNRPLIMHMHEMENENIPLEIPRDVTHETVSSYVDDLFSLHDARLRHQPNAITDKEDGLYQMSALVAMRGIWPCFFQKNYSRGPFFLSLTDLTQSNIFVDEDWNPTCLLDLEWAHSRPVEAIHPPYWLSGDTIDDVRPENFAETHAAFMQALSAEEEKLHVSATEDDSSFRMAPILQDGWERGSFWYSLALHSPTGLFNFFHSIVKPLFYKDQTSDMDIKESTTPYWGIGAMEFINERLRDKAKYDVALREAFEAGNDIINYVPM